MSKLHDSSLRPVCDLEQWKEIEGFEDYLVSSLGRVRTKKWRQPTPLIRVRLRRAHNYLTVVLRRGGKAFDKDVHRLVAMAFCPRLEGKAVVNHKNGAKLDNRAENLEWVTHKENLAHSVVVLNVDRQISIKKPVIAFPVAGGIGCVYPCARAAEAFGFSSSHIAACAKGRKPQHKGYSWRYLENGA